MKIMYGRLQKEDTLSDEVTTMGDNIRQRNSPESKCLDIIFTKIDDLNTVRKSKFRLFNTLKETGVLLLNVQSCWGMRPSSFIRFRDQEFPNESDTIRCISFDNSVAALSCKMSLGCRNRDW